MSVCIDGEWLQKVKWVGRVGAAPEVAVTVAMFSGVRVNYTKM